MILVLNRDQRDALLGVCDLRTDMAYDDCDSDFEDLRAMPMIAALADSLVLPDAHGAYRISGMPRAELEALLWREKHAAEECLDPEILRIHSTCAALLDRLGSEPTEAVA